jgi:hypothetical protein
MIEWGIVHHRSPGELHRGPMSYDDAEKWIKEFEDDGGQSGAFYLVCRTVSDWSVRPKSVFA